MLLRPTYELEVWPELSWRLLKPEELTYLIILWSAIPREMTGVLSVTSDMFVSKSD